MQLHGEDIIRALLPFFALFWVLCAPAFAQDPAVSVGLGVEGDLTAGQPVRLRVEAKVRGEAVFRVDWGVQSTPVRNVAVDAKRHGEPVTLPPDFNR